MKPYYEHGGIQIFHGDCREVLPGLGPVDLVLTDPPYGVGYAAGRQRGNVLGARIANDDSLAVVAEVWPAALTLLNNNRHWYAFASPRMLPGMMSLAEPKHVIAWDKGDRGTMGDLEYGFGDAWEAILYGMKGRRPLNGPRPRTVIRHDWAAHYDPSHPTVKPVALLGRLVQWSSFEDEIVLDPFMGSGTTLRAAKDLGRRAIGIELEERYCEIAAKRLEQEVLDLGGAA